ncbi:unnamed protein product [Schistosoma margrebowiei]|uniref:Integrase catalytic domain-containing protein n=1 Tax=Schistosoma margrebowiei TaxID=48269 RepID=A0AA85AEQ3_9TREM|nr:unnamed protein product [Schistosoma margrebowiei]
MDPSKLELLLEQQMKLIQMLADAKLTSNSQPSSSNPITTAPSVDGIANSISEFHYDPESNVTFDMWFRRYEDLFKFDFANQDDAWKVRLLLRKLGPSELDKYCNLILPLNPRDRSFSDTVQSLSQQFGDNSSLFNARYRCLKLTMNEDDDFLTHVGIVNRECERFRLKSLTEDQFKALILICSLQSQKFSDIRTRLLSRLDQDPKLTLNDIANEYQRLINLQRDTTMVQRGGSNRTEVHVVQQPLNSHKSAPATSSSGRQTKTNPPAPCWHCGAWHFVRYCPYKQHRCRKCNAVGHKDGFCRKKKPSNSRGTRKPTPRSNTNSLSLIAGCENSTPVERKFITLNINGHSSRLQIDTASDVTILSRKTWTKMGSPNLQCTTQKPRTACGNYLHLLGQMECTVTFRELAFVGVCYITPADLNLLGLDWFDHLNLADVPLNTICNLVSQPQLRQQPHDLEAYTRNLMTEFSTSEHHTAGEDAVIASPLTEDRTQCQQAAKCNAKILPVPWPQPEYPWSRIHVDFAGPINGITYLVVVDAFSKWPEIVPVIPPTTTQTIQLLTEMFSRNGLPDIIVSDNGSQFTSSQFQEFCKRLSIKHFRSPPYHPQSNGQAERFVDTFKRALMKSKGEGTTVETLQNFLFVYRTTPNDMLPQQKSPAEILMGRKLSTIHSLMCPRTTPPPSHNKSQKLPAYEVGCPVFARDYRANHGPWIEARVIGRLGQVMYEVKVGRDTWTRHRNQLRKRIAPDHPSNGVNLPLDILLDTFNLPAAPSQEAQQQADPRPRRWPLRQRRTTVKMQVDPRKARY